VLGVVAVRARSHGAFTTTIIAAFALAQAPKAPFLPGREFIPTP
jgi:hypothetical protein